MLKGTQEPCSQGHEPERGRYKHGVEDQHLRFHYQGGNRHADRRNFIGTSNNEEIEVKQPERLPKAMRFYNERNYFAEKR